MSTPQAAPAPVAAVDQKSLDNVSWWTFDFEEVLLRGAIFFFQLILVRSLQDLCWSYFEI